MATLNRDTLSIVMLGTTHVIDMGGKQAFIYYENEVEAHMQLPDGTRRHGRWRLTEDGYSVEWRNGPTASWQLNRRQGGIDYLDSTGVARGSVARIDFGDSAQLAT
jgi:hypothetical protein